MLLRLQAVMIYRLCDTRDIYMKTVSSRGVFQTRKIAFTAGFSTLLTVNSLSALAGKS